jgi:hypothetical protein
VGTRVTFFFKIRAQVAATIAAFVRREFEAASAADLALLDPTDLLVVITGAALKKVSAAKLAAAWRDVQELTPGSELHRARLAVKRDARDARQREAGEAALARQRRADARRANTAARAAAAATASAAHREANGLAATASREAADADQNAARTATAAALVSFKTDTTGAICCFF